MNGWDMRRAMAIGVLALLVGGVVAAMLVAALRVVGPAAAAPGVPAAPTTMFTEDFENGLTTTPVNLADYTGATPQSLTYTANEYYLNNSLCDGLITSFSSTVNAPCNDSFGPGTFDAWSRTFAKALGRFNDPATEDSNHAVVDFTTSGVSPANGVQLQTVNPFALTGGQRFLSFGLDVAAAFCGNGPATVPQLDFFLLDGPTAIPSSTTPIQPCTDPGSQSIVLNVPGVGNQTFRVGRYATNGSVLFAGSTVGFRLVNRVNVSGLEGNDMAFDNVRVLDATPALDKAFTPTSVTAGTPSTLTFTITNTSELGAKAGWSFTDNLSAGLVVAPLPNASTTCTNGTTTAASGGSSVQVGGDLNAGQASCTASVDVVSLTAGDYTNGPANVTNLRGVNPPAQTATLEVSTPALPTTTSTSTTSTSTTSTSTTSTTLPTSTTSTTRPTSTTSTSTTSTTSPTSTTSVPPLNQLLGDVGRLLGAPTTTTSPAPTTTSTSTTSTTRPTSTTSVLPRTQLPATGLAHQTQLWGLLLLLAGGASRFLASVARRRARNQH